MSRNQPSQPKKPKSRKGRKTSVPREPRLSTYSFSRAVTTTIPISSGSSGAFGWNNVGTNSLQVYFSLQNFHYDTGGSANTQSMPSYTEFTALFDEWKIRHVDFDLYFSKDDHSGATVNSQLPILYACTDFTDSLPVSGADEVLQYNPYHVRQLGNARGEDPRVRLSVNPRLNMTNNAGGTALSGQEWCNSIYPDVLWRGIKLWYDNQVTGTPVAVGWVTMVTTVHYEFRCPR